MKCRVCGAENEDSQFNFCRFCGAPRDVEEDAPAEQVSAPVQEIAPVEEIAPATEDMLPVADAQKAAPVAEDDKKNKKKKGSVATAVVAATSALVLLGSGCYVAYNNGLISLPSSAGTAEASEAAAVSGSGDHAKAATLYEKAIEQAPDNAEYYLSAADAYIAAGAYEKAEECLSRGVMKTGNEQLSEKLYTMRENGSFSGADAPDEPHSEEKAPSPELPPMPDLYMPVYFEFSPASQTVPTDKSNIDPELVQNIVISIKDEHYVSASKTLLTEFKDMVTGDIPMSSSQSYYSYSGKFDDLQNAGCVDNYGFGRPQGKSYEFDENGRLCGEYDYVNKVTTTYYYVYDENGKPIRRYSIGLMEEGGTQTNVGMKVNYYDNANTEVSNDGSQYDAKGRLIKKVNRDVVTEYVYDDAAHSRKTLVDGVQTSIEWFDAYGQLLRYEKLNANEVLDGSGVLSENAIGKTKRFSPFEKEDRTVTYEDGGFIIIYDGAKDITRSWSGGFLPDYTYFSSNYNFVLAHITASVMENDDAKAFTTVMTSYIDNTGANSVIYRDKDGYITSVQVVQDGKTLETFNYNYTRDDNGCPKALNIKGAKDEYSMEFSLTAITCEPKHDDNGNPVSGDYKDNDGNLVGSATAEYVLWDEDPSDDIAEYLKTKEGEK